MENERQTNYTIMGGFELPSGGKIYDVPVNSHVELRSMTARDEMKRLSPSTTPFKTLADIIEGCMIEKPKVHVYDMAVGDYEYLLHRLRVVTYGDKYKIATTCPYCGETIEAEAHLNDLELKEFDANKFNELKNIELPASGHRVTLKFQTPHILERIEARTKELKRKFKDADIAFDMFALLTNIIDYVDGEKLTDMEVEEFVNKLPALDMTKLINRYDELTASLGLDNAMTIECPKCGQEIETFFRFGTEFFRPTNV